jgi:hypothetical protein
MNNHGGSRWRLPLEIDIDLWEIIEPLLPLLEELERVERLAAGSPPSESKEKENGG